MWHGQDARGRRDLSRRSLGEGGSAARSWAGSPCHSQTHGRDARQATDNSETRSVWTVEIRFIGLFSYHGTFSVLAFVRTARPLHPQNPKAFFRSSAVGNGSFFAAIAGVPASFTRRASAELNSTFAANSAGRFCSA